MSDRSASDRLADVAAGVLPADLDRLKAELRAHRFKEARWLYDGDPPLERDHPYQGDILPDVPLAYAGVTGGARVIRTRALMLSHGCDLPEDGTAVFAPVLPLTELEAVWMGRLGRDRTRSKMASVRDNAVTTYLYLPAAGDLPDSYADLSRVAAVPGPLVDAIHARTSSAARVRLSQNGWYVLVLKLQMHWCRMERAEDYPRAGSAAS